MKQISKYLYQMFKYSPCKIFLIWILDFIYSFIIILTPMLIGSSIDGLTNGEYNCFVWLMIVLFIEIILGFLYRRFDTRIYEKVAINFKQLYFSKAIAQTIDTTELDANIELIDEFSEFLRFFIIRISGIFGILFPLYYLHAETNFIVFLVAIVVTTIVLSIQFSFSVSMQKEITNIKDENEKRRNIIGQRNLFAYRNFINTIMELTIRHSDKDAVSYFISATLQLGLLIFAVFYIVSSGIATAGVIFATITYIIELNAESFELSDIYIDYLSLKDNISRVDI